MCFNLVTASIHAKTLQGTSRFQIGGGLNTDYLIITPSYTNQMIDLVKLSGHKLNDIQGKKDTYNVINSRTK